jgi:hypothetical protein
MRVAALIVLIFAFTVFAQTQFEDKLLLDAFKTESATLIILIPTGGLSPDDPADRKFIENFVSGNDILGSERDLFLFVDSGEQNLVLTVGVSAGTYNSATPNEARGGSALTLDGVDGDSSIDTTGLFGNPLNDFTANDAFAFHTFIETDQPTSVIFTIYSGGNGDNSCSFEVLAPGDDTRREYFLAYEDFERDGTGCDFTNVGAFDITSIMFDNVDIIVEPVYTYGPVDTCVCVCPVFSCILHYDPDDDTFSYYQTSDFGVFNPTTDDSTDGNPPPASSVTSSPRPSGVSATPRPQSDSTTLTLSLTSTDSQTSRNTNSRNSNSQNSRHLIEKKS